MLTFEASRRIEIEPFDEAFDHGKYGRLQKIPREDDDWSTGRGVGQLRLVKSGFCCDARKGEIAGKQIVERGENPDHQLHESQA